MHVQISKHSSQSVNPYFRRRTLFVVLQKSHFPVFTPMSRMLLDWARGLVWALIIRDHPSSFSVAQPVGCVRRCSLIVFSGWSWMEVGLIWHGLLVVGLRFRGFSGIFKLSLLWQTNSYYLSYTRAIYNLSSLPKGREKKPKKKE